MFVENEGTAVELYGVKGDLVKKELMGTRFRIATRLDLRGFQLDVSHVVSKNLKNFTQVSKYVNANANF